MEKQLDKGFILLLCNTKNPFRGYNDSSFLIFENSYHPFICFDKNSRITIWPEWYFHFLFMCSFQSVYKMKIQYSNPSLLELSGWPIRCLSALITYLESGLYRKKEYFFTHTYFVVCIFCLSFPWSFHLILQFNLITF